jgi:hypothetical protein
MKKTLFLVFLLVCIVALIGCSGGTSTYKIKVSGTTGLEFMGSYGGMAHGGDTDIRSVEGTVPRQYTVKATGNAIITCTFMKLEATGTLNVQIFKDGEIVAQSGTSAAFGSVILSTQ